MNVSDIFSEDGIIINKRLASLSQTVRKLPSFVADYLIATLVDEDDPGPGIAKINKLMREHYVDAEDRELIKSRIREHGQYHLVGGVKCRYDQAKDQYWAEIGCLGDQFVRVDTEVLGKYGDTLLTTGAWGTIHIAFDPTYVIKGRRYPFIVVDFQPFQVTAIDTDLWIRRRAEFTDQQWEDLMIESIGFNPDELTDEEKLIQFIRLIPFVESNVNMVELGPPETGKTYNYRQLSSFGHVVSGAKITVASLFYNKLRRRMGVLGYKDCVMFDEIAHANWTGQDDMASMLKDFMNTGRFGRDTSEFSSECSVVFAGNIDCDRKNKKVVGWRKHLFMELPSLIANDRAFLDRIHAFVPGWLAPQVADSKLAKGHAFMADYLSAIMHSLREYDYSNIIMNRIDFGKMTYRNQLAVTRLASGLLKLLYAHRDAQTVTEKELRRVMDIAVDLRQRVVDQLAVIAPSEFAGIKLDYLVREAVSAPEDTENVNA